MYPYDYYYSDTSGEFLLIGILGILLIVALIGLIIGLVLYVFSSIGLHTLAKRRQIRHAWLAWLPIGSAWVLGSVSDQYQYIVKKKDTRRRVILLILAILSSLTGGASGINALTSIPSISPDAMMAAVFALVGTGTLAGLIGLAYKVFRFIALYDLYSSCKDQSNTLLLVLNIIFPVVEPFFLFFFRNSDEGMPARRPAYRQPTPEAEPWERVEN